MKFASKCFFLIALCHLSGLSVAASQSSNDDENENVSVTTNRPVTTTEANVITNAIEGIRKFFFGEFFWNLLKFKCNLTNLAIFLKKYLKMRNLQRNNACN